MLVWSRPNLGHFRQSYSGVLHERPRTKRRKTPQRGMFSLATLRGGTPPTRASSALTSSMLSKRLASGATRRCSGRQRPRTEPTAGRPTLQAPAPTVSPGVAAGNGSPLPLSGAAQAHRSRRRSDHAREWLATGANWQGVLARAPRPKRALTGSRATPSSRPRAASQPTAAALASLGGPQPRDNEGRVSEFPLNGPVVETVKRNGGPTPETLPSPNLATIRRQAPVVLAQRARHVDLRDAEAVVRRAAQIQEELLPRLAAQPNGDGRGVRQRRLVLTTVEVALVGPLLAEGAPHGLWLIGVSHQDLMHR